MAEKAICQSCGMPLTDDAVKGTELSGIKAADYCNYCYENGSFTQDITMDEMIEVNLKHIDAWNADNDKKLTACEAREQLAAFMQTLKRWRTAQ